MRKYMSVFLAVLAIAGILSGCISAEQNSNAGTSLPQIIESSTKNISNESASSAEQILENERYSSPEEVADYIRQYGKLPPNYIRKSEAQSMGWDSGKGNLWDVTDRMSIGGDRFGNREKKLPVKSERVWYECDVNYDGGYRGSERLVYSNDGLIYYTSDHYQTFVLME